MFVLSCSHCSTRRLAFATQVIGVVNDDHGVHALVRCTCGEVNVWDAERDPLAAAV